jgi:hypothetical protein
VKARSLVSKKRWRGCFLDDAFKEVWLDGRLYFRTEGSVKRIECQKGAGGT